LILIKQNSGIKKTIGKNKMKQIIEWIPASKEVENNVPLPKPAKVYIPEWYKRAPAPPSQENYIFDEPGMIGNLGIKSCMPFLDSLMHGYIQESWTDIHFQPDIHGQNIEDYNYPIGPRIISHRDSGKTHLDIPEDYYKTEFAWRVPWTPKLPKGYSLLFTHPLNNMNLPFTSLSGIVDSDMYYHESSGQYPFLLKKGFYGTIPTGTPLFVMIPVKREEWVSKALPFSQDENSKRKHQIRKHLTGGYKKMFWQKKSFS
jgi:hypothetical protein